MIKITLDPCKEFKILQILGVDTLFQGNEEYSNLDSSPLIFFQFCFSAALDFVKKET